MSRKVAVIFLVLAMSLTVLMTANIATARPGDECPPPNGAPVCVDPDGDGVFTHIPPGLFRVCNDDNPKNDNKNCDRIAPPEDGATCPPGTGPISSVVQQISDGIRDGGGAALADVVDTINCEIIVGVLGQ